MISERDKPREVNSLCWACKGEMGGNDKFCRHCGASSFNTVVGTTSGRIAPTVQLAGNSLAGSVKGRRLGRWKTAIRIVIGVGMVALWTVLNIAVLASATTIGEFFGPGSAAKAETPIDIHFAGDLRIDTYSRTNFLMAKGSGTDVQDKIMRITNVGKEKIQIFTIVINDRDDCLPLEPPAGVADLVERAMSGSYALHKQQDVKEFVLQVGEFQEIFKGCDGEFVRVELHTDRGSASYKVNRQE